MELEISMRRKTRKEKYSVFSLMQSTEEEGKEEEGGRTCSNRRDPIWGENKWGEGTGG